MFKDDQALSRPDGLRERQRTTRCEAKNLPWIEVAPDAPYFMTEAGDPWTPVGYNDAVTWPELKDLFRRRDLAAVEAHVRHLVSNGVTCLRLMLEYAQVRHRYIERPVGSFVPGMVQLWDDLFAICERCGLRILLTPFDTFWTWLHWRHYPYNRANGGMLDHPERLLLCGETRQAIKQRLSFAVERWGGSGALFAWDLWNEIHPAQAQESADCFGEFIQDLSQHVRTEELRRYGRAHPQTVSLFGPELSWRPHLAMKEPIFRHPDLDFATLHIYEQGSIDAPTDTVAAAVSMGRIVQEALAEIDDHRPFLDSEHGPIHTFKDRRTTLPEPFDDEYFRHMQWAHLASGGAGGGMRWPNRQPHVLTKGMRQAQAALSAFLPLIDWVNFRRICLNAQLQADTPAVFCFGCGDNGQAVVWVVRNDILNRSGMISKDVKPIDVKVEVPLLAPGSYGVTLFDTIRGKQAGTYKTNVRDGGPLQLDLLALQSDVAVAVRMMTD